MKTGFALKKAISILLMILVLTLLCNVFIMRVSATQTTKISVTPADQTIGEEGVELPTPPHTISITVTDVTDLFTWQIKLYFDNTTLKYEEAWLPPDHVFADKTIMPIAPVVGVDENGTFVWYGCSLILVEDVFTGSGTLCQINFTGMDLGSSALTFDMTKIWDEAMQRWKNERTYLLDPNTMGIPFEATGGSITVLGIPTGKETSVITVDVITPDPKHPGEAPVGSDVIISGAITPVQGVVNVIIQYKEAGTVEWTTLAEVTTDSESRYTYTWTTTETGTYDIRALGGGWTSTTKSVKVTGEEEIDIVPYAIAGVVVIVILAIVIYFIKFRKRE